MLLAPARKKAQINPKTRQDAVQGASIAIFAESPHPRTARPLPSVAPSKAIATKVRPAAQAGQLPMVQSPNGSPLPQVTNPRGCDGPQNFEAGIVSCAEQLSLHSENKGEAP